MASRLVLPIAVAISLGLTMGCKKKAPEESVPSAPAPVEVTKPAAPAHVQEMVANFSKVFFDFDADGLDASSKAALDANAVLMKAHADIKVEIQGHADERGTTEYNMALGQRRAEAVRKYIAQSGIAGTRLSVVSYGEERPASTGSYETAWSQNRRAEFRITWGESTAVQGTTGG
jgi:peptidoglycan-associated lipoprotein